MSTDNNDFAAEMEIRLKAAGVRAVVHYQGGGWFRLRYLRGGISDGVRLRKDKLIERVKSHERVPA